MCCDGLTGLAEAIEATWPQATVQTCVVDLIRASMRFVSYSDRKSVARLLEPVYQAPTEQAAADALDAFVDSDLGRKYPSAVKTFRDAWEWNLTSSGEIPCRKSSKWPYLSQFSGSRRKRRARPSVKRTQQLRGMP